MLTTSTKALKPVVLSSAAEATCADNSVWCRLGRTDIVARGLIQLRDEDHLDILAEVMGSMHSTEAVQASVQVSLELASRHRPDIMTDVCISHTLCLCQSFRTVVSAYHAAVCLAHPWHYFK